MFDALVATRKMLDEIACGFDAGTLSPEAAVRVVDELGAIQRVVDGMVGKAARRVADTSACARDAAGSVARLLGVRAGEVGRAIETARKLESLPETDAAVREGRLSGAEASLIAAAATVNPGAEAELLRVAEQGLVPLQDACLKARVAVEDPAARAQRQHDARDFRWWTEGDGMLVGRFAYPPEVGGQLKAVIEKARDRIFRARDRDAELESNDAYAADAVAAFILEPADAVDSSDGTPNTSKRATNVTMHIVVGYETLRSGKPVPGEVCEIPGVGPVDVNWVREQLGSTFLTAVITKGKDIRTVAHFGRHVPAELMTALLVGGRECDADGCHHRGYLERDHVHEHAKGGPTSYENLCWLCYRHHRLKTSGWIIGPPDPVTRKRKLRPPPERAP